MMEDVHWPWTGTLAAAVLMVATGWGDFSGNKSGCVALATRNTSEGQLRDSFSIS
jgi:hypothetical protein